MFVLQFITFILYVIFVCKYINYAKKSQDYLEDVIKADCSPKSRNNNELVHIKCSLDEDVVYYLPKEFSSNLYSFNGVFLETKVEMFQRVESVGIWGNFYKGEFVDHLVGNNAFYKNPEFFPSVAGSGRIYAKNIKIGGYAVDKEHFAHLSKKRKLSVLDDDWYQPSPNHLNPPLEINNLNTQVYDNSLYTGDPTNPKVSWHIRNIGDVRITFYGSDDVEFSVIGRQTTSTLQKNYAIKPVKFMKENMVLVAEGNYDEQELQDVVFKRINQSPVRRLRIVIALLLALLFCNNYNAERAKLCRIICAACSSGIVVCVTQIAIWSVYNVQRCVKLSVGTLVLVLILLATWTCDALRGRSVRMKARSSVGSDSFDSAIWPEESMTIIATKEASRKPEKNQKKKLAKK